MSWFDVLIIIILAGFAWYGFFFGLIRVIGNLLGLFIGGYVAGRIYIPVYNYIGHFIPGNPATTKVVIFIICFGIASRLVGWLFILLEQGFNLISLIPFLKTANRILGLLLGLLEGVLVLGILAYILDRHLPASLPLNHWISHSTIVPLLIKVSKLLAPLLPQFFSRLQSLV